MDATEVINPDTLVIKEANGDKAKLSAKNHTLQFKKGVTTENTEIYVGTVDGYKKIVSSKTSGATNEIELIPANVCLMRAVGYALKYEEGKGAFFIPIKHYGWYREGNGNRTEGTDNEIIDWPLVRPGDFGIVRNHVYDIDVTIIKGLASGIPGDTPIIPSFENKTNYMVYRVNVLRWALVPKQIVEL